MSRDGGARYRDAGVDIKRGEEAVQRIKKHVESTFTKNVLRGVGSFAGALDITQIKNMKEPVLLSTMDGVGTKTAVALLAYFGSLEEVCARSAEIPSLGLRGGGRIRRLIEEQREMALMSKRLATVARDAVIDTSLDDLRLAAPRHAVLDPLFERLGFDTLYQRIVGRR